MGTESIWSNVALAVCGTNCWRFRERGHPWDLHVSWVLRAISNRGVIPCGEPCSRGIAQQWGNEGAVHGACSPDKRGWRQLEDYHQDLQARCLRQPHPRSAGGRGSRCQAWLWMKLGATPSLSGVARNPLTPPSRARRIGSPWAGGGDLGVLPAGAASALLDKRGEKPSGECGQCGPHLVLDLSQV